MPLFETPRPPLCSSRLHAWSDNIEPRMRNHYREYYKRFNTIQIPILRESDYFNNAIKVTKLTHGQEAKFKRIFTERNTKRQEKLLSQIARVASQIIYMDEDLPCKVDGHLPCKDARNAVSEVCQTGCLLGFLRLLKGAAYGFEADAIEDAQLDNATNLNDEIQNSPEKPQTIDEEMQDHYNGRIHGALDGKADPYHYEIDSDYNDETQLIDDNFYYDSLREEQPSASATFYIGTYMYTRYTPPTSNNTTHSPNVSASDTSISENQPKKISIPTTQGKRKRAQYDEDVIDAQSHRQGLKSITSSSISDTSIQQAIDRSATDEKPPPDGGYSRVSKRQKLESPSTLKPTPTSLSPQLTTDKGVSRKRSRYKNCNNYDDYDYDDYDHRHKRRRLESSGARTLSHTSSTQQLADQKVAAKKKSRPENEGHRCDNRKKKKPCLKISRSPAPGNTRSLRSTAQSTFCELDHSGKKRSV
ncbi:hypothetical protein GGI35DRAFT_453284 [Trichoderma velutinum]